MPGVYHELGFAEASSTDDCGEVHKTQALIDSGSGVSTIKVSCIPSNAAMSSVMHEIVDLGGMAQASGSVELLLDIAGWTKTNFLQDFSGSR